ncbi:hypothetical protein IMZ48_22650 [Candidatus Bathyarchaeota archaeon]|nr:hypothetical protein [Candidatus Bathyarchaeota archaeon]
MGPGGQNPSRHYPADAVLAAVTSDRIAELTLKCLKFDGEVLRSLCSKLDDRFDDVSLAWLKLTGGSWWPALHSLTVRKRVQEMEREGKCKLTMWPLDGQECTKAFKKYVQGCGKPRVSFNLKSPTSGKVVVRMRGCKN